VGIYTAISLDVVHTQQDDCPHDIFDMVGQMTIDEAQFQGFLAWAVLYRNLVI